VLYDRLLAAQRHPLAHMGFNPPRGGAQFLSPQEILLDHWDPL
jgi:hypothetical protein